MKTSPSACLQGRISLSSIRDGMPRALESTVPGFLGVPDTRRIGGNAGHRHGYSGGYRLRRSPVG